MHFLDIAYASFQLASQPLAERPAIFMQMQYPTDGFAYCIFWEGRGSVTGGLFGASEGMARGLEDQ